MVADVQLFIGNRTLDLHNCTPGEFYETRVGSFTFTDEEELIIW